MTEFPPQWYPNEEMGVEQEWDGKKWTGKLRSSANQDQKEPHPAANPPNTPTEVAPPTTATTQASVPTTAPAPSSPLPDDTDSPVRIGKPSPQLLGIVGTLLVGLLLVIWLSSRGDNQQSTQTTQTNQTASTTPDNANQSIFSTTGPGVVDEFKPGLYLTPIQWMSCDTDGTFSPIEIRVNYTNLTSTATPIIQTAVREVVTDLETATNNLNITLGADYTETPANTYMDQIAGRSELRQIYILFSPDGTLFLDHDLHPKLKDKDQGMRRRWHSGLNPNRIQAGYIQIDPTFATTLDSDGIKLAIARQMLRILGLELVDSGNEMLTVETKTPGSDNFFKYKTNKYQYGPGETAWLQTAGNTEGCN